MRFLIDLSKILQLEALHFHPQWNMHAKWHQQYVRISSAVLQQLYPNYRQRLCTSSGENQVRTVKPISQQVWLNVRRPVVAYINTAGEQWSVFLSPLWLTYVFKAELPWKHNGVNNPIAPPVSRFWASFSLKPATHSIILCFKRKKRKDKLDLTGLQGNMA